MLKNLLSLYENSILFPVRPENPSEQYHIFFDQAGNDWVGIPKSLLSDQELRLLKTLYEIVEYQSPPVSSTAKGWDEFLFLDGPLPSSPPDSCFRFIQFKINGNDASQTEIEAALRGFFSEEVIIVWENGSRGIVIEEKKQISLSEEELISMSETLESDFYVRVSFFFGKLNPFSKQLRAKFLQEKDYFSFGLNSKGSQHIYTFERVFPAYLAYHLPEDLNQKGMSDIQEIFTEDPELFSTIKVFLEHNLNASLTAKKLYIHRNTLQYRIDKFTEKSGISLKDFYGAFTVFLACLLFEEQ